MGLIFEAIPTEGLAAIAYLVGDSSTGTAALVDPSADVDRYLRLAQQKDVAITHVFETHIHADMLSGSRELHARLPNVKLCLSWEGGAEYGFPHHPVHDGDRFPFGELVLTARHTPGHTPEHMAYLLSEKRNPHLPWGVLSGDSLFVNSVGRPDLLGTDQAQKLATQQFHTLRDFYTALPDGLIVYPGHGAGSSCGAAIGDRPCSTIGYEKANNPYLQFTEVEAFIDYALSSAPPQPTYYPRLKRINAEGPPVLGKLPEPPALTAQSFQKALQDEDHVLVDTRSMFAFGGGHIPGAINLGAAPCLSIWAGWFLPPDRPILLVVEPEHRDKVVRYLLRTGFSDLAGYLAGGMAVWSNAGFPIQDIPQRSVQQLRDAGNKLQLVDVRSNGEFEKGYIPGAVHIPLPRLSDQLFRLEPDKPTAVYCATGYRASLATSLLKQHGFKSVHNIPGSWQAWKEAGFPIAGAPEDTVLVPQARIPKVVLKPPATNSSKVVAG